MMTSKERVLRAINHQTVDRVPLDLGGMACSLLDGVYFKLKDQLGIQGDIEPFRQGSNSCYYDERILDRLGIDVRRVFAKTNGKFPRHNEDGTFCNEWGILQRQGKFGVEFVKAPLQNATEADLECYPWPKARDVLVLDGLKERARQLHEENQYAISLRAPMNGIFEISCWLRGLQGFMVDTIINPEFAHALAEKVLEVQLDWYGFLLDEIGQYVDIVETGDDYGAQNALLISEACLEEFILSRRKRLNDMIRQKAPQAKIFLHCCGSIQPIISNLAACGVDILNPLQTAAVNMDPFTLKEKYGDQICFHGGVDTQHAMTGTVEDVKAEVRKMLDAMHHNGGYILTSCNHIQNDIPVENIIQMFETAKEYSGS